MEPHVSARTTGSLTEAGASRIELTLEAFEHFMQLVSVGHAPDIVEMSMSMAQVKVLYLLGTRREIHMSELIAMLGVSTSTVSGLVDRLVDSGYASRRDDPADRRHVVVGITERGAEVLDRFRELGQRRMRMLLEDLDATEIATVHRAIEVLTAAATRKDHQ